jgi:hypothetical protein
VNYTEFTTAGTNSNSTDSCEIKFVRDIRHHIPKYGTLNRPIQFSMSWGLVNTAT